MTKRPGELKMKKYAAEFLGTFILVLIGCGTIVVGLVGAFGNYGIALAFGFAFVAAAYGVGTISGFHFNPAVSLGNYIAGRLGVKDLAGYVVSQCLGAIAAAAVLLLIVKGKKDGYNLDEFGLGETSWGRNDSGYGIDSALIFEFLATFVLVSVFLGATRGGAPVAMAGLAVGITLAAIHLFGINISGASVNPARSLGPALFTGGEALRQLWLYIVAPSAGGIAAGALYHAKVL
jgi:aquaporin Z